MRSWRSTHNLIAVSANTRETAINTEQTLDTTMLCTQKSIPNLEPRREDNSNEATGHEEPDTIYDLGATAKMAFEFEKAQPQHVAFILAYGLGSVSTAAAGTGYQHTITPISGDLDTSRSNPSFSLGARMGSTVLKRLFASYFINDAKLNFTADDWVKLTAEAIGTGKYTNNVTEESITAAENATQLTLAANAVHGATAAARLDNVQRIRVELSTGVWTEVSYSAVSAATPAVITISAPGGTATTRTYKVLYIPAEAAWCTFPSRVTESPMRVSQMSLNVGGTWTGSAFSGGRSLSAELKSIEWELKNDMKVQFVPGAGDTYAARGFRQARTQKIKLNREFREYIMQQHIDDNDTFGLYILCQGAEFDTGHNYQVEVIFPKVGIIAAPITEGDKVLAEEGDLQVLEDDTYGSVIVKVKNLVATYAA